MPKGLGGQNDDYPNPELFFGAAYSACYDGALNLVARMERFKITSTTTANVSIGKVEDGSLAISVVLDIDVQGVDKETAQKLIEKARPDTGIDTQSLTQGRWQLVPTRGRD